jgi:formate-dependent nitrite reductase membrane component NrfD
MKGYEWMTTYTPQTEWIKRKGVFTPLAFYSGLVGGGLYLISVYFDNIPGIALSWIIVTVIKGIFHMMDLHKPLRAFRMVLRPQTSWISRGLLFVIVFAVSVPAQLFAALYFPGTGLGIIFETVGVIAAFGLCLYPGFTLNCLNALPVWNSALVPPLFVAAGLLGGFALFEGIGIICGTDTGQAGTGGGILLGITALLLGIYLLSAQYMGPIGKQATKEIISGHLSVLFWGGAVIVGLIMPLSALLLGHAAVTTSFVSNILTMIGQIIGGLSLIFIIMEIGAYNPLAPLS